MNDRFKNGFEKTAGLAGLVVKSMPKIFKHLTYKGGKFSAGKAFGTGLTGYFGVSEAGNVISKTRNQMQASPFRQTRSRFNVNRYPSYQSMIPKGDIYASYH